jgi:hypothetical protein
MKSRERDSDGDMEMRVEQEIARMERLEAHSEREVWLRAFNLGRSTERSVMHEHRIMTRIALLFWGFVMGLLAAGIMSTWLDRPPL